MPIVKQSPTKTTLQKIKKEAKKLSRDHGSLQQRQNTVAKSFGYEGYHDFIECYKRNSILLKEGPFEGKGYFAGELLVGSYFKDGISVDSRYKEEHLESLSVIEIKDYEVTHRFQLSKGMAPERPIQAFLEEIEKHVQDYVSLIFKSKGENQKSPYDDFIELEPDCHLRSVDIAVGIDFPEGLAAPDEFKFAESWFYDQGKGGRISLANFPNDGLVPRKAVPVFLSVIRAVAEHSFGKKCYAFPSVRAQDLR